MKIESLISEKYSTFSEGEVYLAKYILNNKETIQNLSITELANNSLTSKSSVLRFAQKLGFSGFTEMKNFMKWGNFFSENPFTHSDLGNYIYESIKSTLDHIKSTNLNDIHKAIDESQHIYLIGTGLAQQNLAAEMQRIFLGIGKEMQVIFIGMQNNLYQILIERMCEKDLLVIFSHSGNNPTLKEALTTPLLKNVKIFSITSHHNNWLFNHSTFHIPVHVEQSNMIISLFSPYHAIIELLAYSYIEYKNSK
ncbi:MurR/RpiR family transcriptional regulator [Paenibacillus massiliensis]|uniref:MurR/RpiR family transcriptional regulator n=1 Tax=Paenibacillus massiliensis TaxID=225917 RepID=UPI000410D709|nr:MurR/RpiR family transcriptional regulator [Paenibacillus massiliensis]